jgi:hypothetical protein
VKGEEPDRLHRRPGKNLDSTDALESIVLTAIQRTDLAFGAIIGG